MYLNIIYEAGSHVPINNVWKMNPKPLSDLVKDVHFWGKYEEIKLTVPGLGQSRPIPERINSLALVVVGDKLCRC